jgi:hypothetical protein
MTQHREIEIARLIMPICRQYSNGLCDNEYAIKSKILIVSPGYNIHKKGSHK